jgi:hypothetical protein
MENNSKRSQITIFVILAMIIVVIIAIVFLIMNRPGAGLSIVENPEAYMQKCLQDSIIKNEKKILDANGYLDKKDNYIIYNGTKAYYICKASQFYVPCINQDPVFLETIRRQLEREVKKDSDVCLTKLRKELERKNYGIHEGNSSFRLEIFEKIISVDINKKITFSKGEDIRTINEFSAETPSPLYGLAKTVQYIVNYESTFCEFNNVNWMLNFPGISINRFIASEGTKVYTITERTSNKQIKFAVKTCILPAGI